MMRMNGVRRSVLAAGLGLAALSLGDHGWCAQAAEAARPDSLAPGGDDAPRPKGVVLIFIDDMGYGDLSCYGSSLCETPRLDALALEGLRSTDFYVSQPVCSASRASLLTGCYSNRIGIHGALGPKNTHGLSSEELTLAEVCRSAGMATAAFGKWHLGWQPQFLPTRHGFDEYYGIPYSNDMWPGHPEAPNAWGDLPTFEGEDVVAYNGDQRRLTRELTRRSVDFLERCAQQEQPFFLYLAHPQPHVPLYVEAGQEGTSGKGLLADVFTELDRSVGAVLDALRDLQLEDDTLVVFTTDNGPWLSYGNHAGSTAGLREGKGTTFEGGVRVPCLLRWPGVIPAGGECREPWSTLDVMPTVAGLLGVDLPEHPIDGRDALALWTREQPATREACDPDANGPRGPEEPLLFYYGQGDLEALRLGRWKLHFPHGYRTMRDRAVGKDGIPGEYDYGVRTELALFDLWEDPGETRDLSAEQPVVLERLQRLADGYRVELGDRARKVKGAGVRKPGRVRK